MKHHPLLLPLCVYEDDVKECLLTAIELLSPAGNLDKLRIGFRYGADAVYLGGKAFNLRAKSSNFSNTDLKTAVDYAHGLGKRVYVTLNILAHDREIHALPQFVKYLASIAVDAVIVADLGVFDLVRECSDLPIHVSTQASATNWRSVKVWQKMGAKRVVLAREMNLNEIKKIKDQVPDMELEVFVHGAMCMTYSGRCNLSNYFNDRDGNRGVCTNSCRWKYSVVEEKRPGEYFPVYEDDTGTYMYNSKDLCTVEFIDKILDAGVTGLKLEGRMKSHFYCANATRIYREAVDAYLGGHFQVDPRWRIELERMTHRGYTSGFYLGSKLDPGSENIHGKSYGEYSFAGLIREDLGQGHFIMESRDKFDPSQTIEVLKPGLQTPVPLVLGSVEDMKSGQQVQMVQPNMRVRIHSSVPLSPLDVLISAQGLS